ncbi:MAG TPA: type II toxin-antitoxin system VapB family antitoxin [bacterium]|nr:type II toxin-antitoxin system VapB family antitoxin [bacterium]
MLKRTRVDLDENLMAACQKATGIKTRDALVDYALRELLRTKDIKKVMEIQRRTTSKRNPLKPKSGNK